MYDVIVIGGGTGGYVASSLLASNDISVALVEKDIIGGTCIRTGCAPTIFENTLFSNIYRYREWGNYVGVDIGISIGDYKHKMKEIIDFLSNVGENVLKSRGVDVYYGEGKLISADTVEVGGKLLRANKIIISTGSEPIKQFPKRNVLDENTWINANFSGERVGIVGGGPAGVEFAQIISRQNSDVYLITHGELLSKYPLTVREKVKSILDWDGVRIFENRDVLKMEENVIVTTQETINVDKIILATGRVPVFPKGVENLVSLDVRGIIIDDNMRTSKGNIYAIGDVAKKPTPLLAHVAFEEAIIASLNILGKPTKIDYSSIPQVIYLDPKIGIVGNESEAEKFVEYPFSASSKAAITGYREGYVKLGIKGDRVVYGEIVGDQSDELISVISLFVKYRLPISKLLFTIFPHFTYSEIIINAMKRIYNIDSDLPY
ncbi:pyridine nucleotide-disulfide oxidoreductase [Sulfolobales archaeon HS-7]|nr:pyridine nucleotide-disulfide oxidoreductase [Sulfolobales archaeon HS-7]